MAIAAFQKSLGERGDGLPSEGVREKLEKVVAERAAASAPKPKEKAVAATGTGFYISSDTIVTNFHVVNGCAEIRLHKSGGDLGAAQVLATSRADDLAALRPAAPAKSFLRLRIGAPIKAAEPVLVFGYPLAEALSSAGNTTVGNVTALAGLGDNSRYIQISAAVQPGNSGGPAIDEAGRLMGVVVAKLNALAIARLTGDIPQNVNFAIKVATLVILPRSARNRLHACRRRGPRADRHTARRARGGQQHPDCVLEVMSRRVLTRTNQISA